MGLPTLLQAFIGVITMAAGVILVYQAIAVEAIEEPKLYFPVLVTSVVLAATKPA